jgi:hypothetical protein
VPRGDDSASYGLDGDDGGGDLGKQLHRLLGDNIRGGLLDADRKRAKRGAHLFDLGHEAGRGAISGASLRPSSREFTFDGSPSFCIGDGSGRAIIGFRPSRHCGGFVAIECDKFGLERRDGFLGAFQPMYTGREVREFSAGGLALVEERASAAREGDRVSVIGGAFDVGVDGDQRGWRFCLPPASSTRAIGTLRTCVAKVVWIPPTAGFAAWLVNGIPAIGSRGCD